MTQPQLGAEKISAIDRLYRTQKERRQFEADTGLARLRVGDAGFALDLDSGHLAIYQQWFMGWALRRLAERASANQ